MRVKIFWKPGIAGTESTEWGTSFDTMPVPTERILDPGTWILEAFGWMVVGWYVL